MKYNKLSMEFGLVIGLMTALLLAACWLLLGHLAEVDRRLSDGVDARWAKTQLADAAIRYSSRNNRITMQVFMVPKSAVAPLLAERARNSDRISDLLDEIGKRANSPDEKKLLQEIWDSRRPYVDSYKEALGLLLYKGEFEHARLKMVNETLPRLIDYHESWEQFVQYQGEQLKEVNDASTANFKMAREQMMWLLGASVALTSMAWAAILMVLARQRRLSGTAQHGGRSQRLSTSLPVEGVP